jgi:NAD(P)-dependent dehydrogenase (short-subunit alcohol dehydrogenase family)
MSPQSVHQFAEKVALISDGTSPIGRAVALQLALQGSFVIVAFPESSGESTRAIQELVELGTLAKAVNADVSRLHCVRDLIAEVDQAFGRLDLLVNCLKYNPESSFQDSTETDFSDTIDKNLRSAYFLTQAAMGLMKDRPKPKIVNIISAGDVAKTSENALFMASQAAVIGLTRSLAESLSDNFRINCVAVSDRERGKSSLDDTLFRQEMTIKRVDRAERAGIDGQLT